MAWALGQRVGKCWEQLEEEDEEELLGQAQPRGGIGYAGLRMQQLEEEEEDEDEEHLEEELLDLRWR